MMMMLLLLQAELQGADLQMQVPSARFSAFDQWCNFSLFLLQAELQGADPQMQMRSAVPSACDRSCYFVVSAAGGLQGAGSRDVGLDQLLTACHLLLVLLLLPPAAGLASRS
jgi:hypothetical protein